MDGRSDRGLKSLSVRSLFVFVVAVACCVPHFRPAAAFDGPLSVRNQFPLVLPALPPSFESAGLGDSFSLSLSHSSVNLVENTSQWSVGLDMEITELALRFAKRIGERLQLSATIPILVFGSGVMDEPLEWYHRTFGFPDYGRGSRPDNSFLYEVSKNGRLLIKGQNGRIGIGDVKLAAQYCVYATNPVISLRAEVELPTGDAKSGYGNGSLDAGLSVLIDGQLGRSVKVYGNAGIVFPGDLRGYERINLEEFGFAAAGVEVLLSERFSVLGQVVVQGMPFPKTGISGIDGTSIILPLGVRYRSGPNTFEVSLTEDPGASGAPDFTVTALYRRHF